jgi:hypothetical protein
MTVAAFDDILHVIIGANREDCRDSAVSSIELFAINCTLVVLVGELGLLWEKGRDYVLTFHDQLFTLCLKFVLQKHFNALT